MLLEEDTDQPFATLLRDLDTVRKRLDQAQEWLRDGTTSVTVAALAEKTKHICQQASQCDDANKLPEFLGQAKECLRDLEKLLGFH